MTVSGTGLPVGTKIASIGINGSLTFDQNATATGTGVTLTFGSYAAGTLTLTGTSTHANEIKGILRDSVSNIDATTTILAITKTGVGKWVLSGANNYTGPTTSVAAPWPWARTMCCRMTRLFPSARPPLTRRRSPTPSAPST